VIAKGAPCFAALTAAATSKNAPDATGGHLILKRRIAEAELNPQAFSAHGLRSGYLTETARRGIPLPEAMQQSQHCSMQQALSLHFWNYTP
jgi:hypothetical protein